MRLVLGALVALAASAAAQPVPGPVTPIYHGQMRVKPAAGTIDPTSALATMTLRGWRWLPQTSPASNGIFPDLEQVRLWIGLSGNDFRTNGQVVAKANGKRFTYTWADGSTRGIKRMKLRALRDGTYDVSLTLVGVSLGTLLNQDSDCVNFTFVIGDDDAFLGVRFGRKGAVWYNSKRLLVKGFCPPDTSGWPGL